VGGERGVGGEGDEGSVGRSVKSGGGRLGENQLSSSGNVEPQKKRCKHFSSAGVLEKKAREADKGGGGGARDLIYIFAGGSRCPKSRKGGGIQRGF